MKIYLKLSTSQKPLHRLSTRRRNEVMSQVRKNLRLQVSRTHNVESKKNSDLEDIPASPVAECSSSNNVNVENNIDINSGANIEDDRASCSFSTFSQVSHASSSSSIASSSSSDLSELSFQEHLASSFVDSNLTHTQGNKILSVLKKHACFSNLPKDVRTLLNTLRHRVVVCKVEPGEYIHFNLEIGIIESLSNISFVPVVTELELDFNTDGCTLDRSSIISI